MRYFPETQILIQLGLFLIGENYTFDFSRAKDVHLKVKLWIELTFPRILIVKKRQLSFKENANPKHHSGKEKNPLSWI